MKLLVFSDLHNDRKALERLMAMEADAYVCAGDLVSWARGLAAMAELMEPRAAKVLILPGNHESHADMLRVCGKYGFRDLHGKSFEMDGVHVAGLGYSNPTPFNTPGEYSEAQLAERLEAFESLQPLILICHCPPKDTPLDGLKDGAHFGSTAVAEFIGRKQPVRFFSGHIHETEGVEARLGRTLGVNAGKRGYLLDTSTLVEA